MDFIFRADSRRFDGTFIDSMDKEKDPSALLP
jgi:hypothetical protein